MSGDAISLIQVLRNSKLTAHINLAHCVVILCHNSLSLYQARKFLYSDSAHKLLQNQNPLSVDWRLVNDKQLAEVGRQAYKFVAVNRQQWEVEQGVYEKNMARYQELLGRLSDRVPVLAKMAKDQVLQELVKKNENSIMQKNSNVLSQTEHSEMVSILKALIMWDSENKKFIMKDDQQSARLINEIMELPDMKAAIEKGNKADLTKKAIDLKAEEFSTKLKVIGRKLKQIFLSYCKEIKLPGQDHRSINVLDLKLFLKYFKDFEYQLINKYRYRVSIITQLFKQEAIHGGSYIQYQQFWEIHKKLFVINEALGKKEMVDESNLAIVEHRYDYELQKLQEVYDIISSERHDKGPVNPKTEGNYTRKYVSVSNEAKVIHTSRNKQYQTTKNESKELDKGLSAQLKKFILEVRQQLPKKQPEERKSIYSKNEIFTKHEITDGQKTVTTNPNNSSKLISVVLPKLLRLSDEKLSTQGICKSLRKFANYDYLAQQKKFRDIIGIPFGEDDEYFKAYLAKQAKLKQQKQQQQQALRQQRKRKALQKLTKKSQSCKKYNPEEVEPYMRF